jgi:hypothetical protein
VPLYGALDYHVRSASGEGGGSLAAYLLPHGLGFAAVAYTCPLALHLAIVGMRAPPPLPAVVEPSERLAANDVLQLVRAAESGRRPMSAKLFLRCAARRCALLPALRAAAVPYRCSPTHPPKNTTRRPVPPPHAGGCCSRSRRWRWR